MENEDIRREKLITEMLSEFASAYVEVCKLSELRVKCGKSHDYSRDIDNVYLDKILKINCKYLIKYIKSQRPYSYRINGKIMACYYSKDYKKAYNDLQDDMPFELWVSWQHLLLEVALNKKKYGH